MAHDAPSSNTSTIADEKRQDGMNGFKKAPESEIAKEEQLYPDHPRVRSPDKETEANIFPEREALAEADLEKMSEEPPKPVVGGINPADFPDGGLEAWLVSSI